MNSDNKLGKRIKLLRKSMGLTQEQLAEKAEMDYKYLSKIENGKHLPTYNTLIRLSAILGGSIGDFNDVLTNIDENKSPDYLQSIRILKSAKNQKEQAYYLEVLKVAQKGLYLSE